MADVPIIHRDNFRLLTGMGRDFCDVVEDTLYELLLRTEHRPLLTAIAEEPSEAPVPGNMAIPPELACNLRVTFQTRRIAVAEVVPLETSASGTQPFPLYLTVRVPNPERRQFFTFSMNFGYVIARAETLHKGSHTVYTHRIRAPKEAGNLIYTGITRQGWQKRWTQHQRDAKAGSRHLFHRALREYPNAEYSHRVIAAGLTEDFAMRMEEMWADHTLHPKGLNMIPGGYAGLKYLHKLGAVAPRQSVDVDRREEILSDFIARTEREGRPNPLLAALWRDDDFAARVICGPEGRLKPNQIADARLLSSFGKDIPEIAATVGAKNEMQVKRLLKGQTYSRVK
jgi:hypothetical protein